MTDIVERLRLRRDPLTDGERAEAADEIERLRAHIAEIEAWRQQGEDLLAPASSWGEYLPSSTLFKLGNWWALRPWR
jgi:hypothetical protein